MLIGCCRFRGADNLIGAPDLRPSRWSWPPGEHLWRAGTPASGCRVQRPFIWACARRDRLSSRDGRSSAGCLVAEELQYLCHEQVWCCFEGLMADAGEFGHGNRREGGGEFRVISL